MLDFSKKNPLIFDYKPSIVKTRQSKEIIKRPLMIVKVGKRKVEMPALIDSGSDKTISFLKPFGNLLGIDIDDFEGEPDTLSGLFGSGPAWPKHIDIWIGEYRFNIPIFWLTKPFNIESDYQMIVGRKVIFDNFDIVFCQKEGKIYFYKK